MLESVFLSFALLVIPWEWLLPKGRIIITCAGPGRDPHSAIDGGELRPDEHYANISQQEMREALEFATFGQIKVSGNEYWRDTYAIATKAPAGPDKWCQHKRSLRKTILDRG
jgi:hypothetical protein